MDGPKSKGTDAPMCKICGARHWFRDPHVFAKGGGKAKALGVAVTKAAKVPAKKARKAKKRRAS